MKAPFKCLDYGQYDVLIEVTTFFFNERFQVTVVTNTYALKLKITESVTVPITSETFFKPVVMYRLYSINRKETADLVTFSEEILNPNLGGLFRGSF